MGDLESSQSQYQHLGVPDQEWTAVRNPNVDSFGRGLTSSKFYEKNAARVPHLVGSPQHLRDVMAELKVYATAMAPQFTGLTTKDIQVKVSDGVHIPCRIYTPVGAQTPAPGLL